ncbi:hypothetical protein NLG97_g11165 [Lecanicillium saksenae]|uniref:Uncharacterized protein n=1 Tax=Lecanicillium saksenae TaxID=468837 RepID=A0ACC1QB63_9HYPO|nr:hypothetical protein NLG97_g11165 [Lecanicillium saksenae]
MNQAGEAHTWNVTAGTIDAIKVPDGLGRLWIMLIQEAASVLLGKDAGEAPGGVFKRLHVGDVDDKQIAGLSALDFKRPSQIMDLGEIDIANVVGAVIVANLTTRPVQAFDLNSLAGLNRANAGNYRG